LLDVHVVRHAVLRVATAIDLDDLRRQLWLLRLLRRRLRLLRRRLRLLRRRLRLLRGQRLGLRC
jgi:hypothetical protein